MVVLPAGAFRTEDLHGSGRAVEKPAHEVQIRRKFAIARTEVTFEEYDRFAQATDRSLPKDAGWGRGQRPVIYVSWDDASAYVNWLSEQTGKRYRLPSEAQWEYAARVGTETTRFWGDDENQACRYANVHDISSRQRNADFKWPHHKCDDGYPQTAPVGKLAANAFSLRDMLGNVWEWTADCWNGDYSSAPKDAGGRTGGDCSRRVMRGGSWYEERGFARSAYRYSDPIATTGSSLGFRVAQDL
jgi:formylglycine-generating enzyme required for sulfatase activity